MSTSQSTRKKSTDRIASRRFDVPQSWLDAGRDAVPDADELLFTPDRACLERYEHVLPESGNSVNVAESAAIYVRYRNDETGASVERRYEAALRQRGDRVTALPKYLHDGSPALFQSGLAIPRSKVEF
ncbi:hypothetical protein G9464_17185 [Halostella sp. JP-L12]|uniref:hypothetical protein n=1 Tax=Halostella TaxID=1843185 RepID=UPI000EF83D64|nr:MULTISPECIES: hypothetical protein [Halostella]NHN49309.1 hypothetical protein [Halostella sp. JP-L12]